MKAGFTMYNTCKSCLEFLRSSKSNNVTVYAFINLNSLEIFLDAVF